MHDIIRLIIIKIKMKMKNGSQRYDINGSTITHRIIETNSSFHVKQCTTGKV